MTEIKRGIHRCLEYWRAAMRFSYGTGLHAHEGFTLALTDRALHRFSPDRRRYDHRQRGAAVDPARPWLLGVRSGLGYQRIPGRLRWIPVARRSPWRPARSQAGVPRRPG